MPSKPQPNFAHVRDPAVQRIVAARVELLFEDRTLGEIASALILTIDDTEALLRVHGRQLLYNRAAVLKAAPPILKAALKAALPLTRTLPTPEEVMEGLTLGSMEGSAAMIELVQRRAAKHAEGNP